VLGLEPDCDVELDVRALPLSQAAKAKMHTPASNQIVDLLKMCSHRK